MTDYFEDELDGVRGVVARALPDSIGGTLLRWPAATWKDGRARIPAGVVTEIVDPIVAALAPVAPDAEQRTRDLFLAAALEDSEPGEWEWSTDDVVQDPEDGTVMTRTTGGTYAWRSTNGVDQRDQDITDLVTKHGGRVLVCKARGIGVESGESRG